MESEERMPNTTARTGPLARTAGLARAMVSDLATGKRPFTVKQMQAVASIFGLPATVFLPKKPRLSNRSSLKEHIEPTPL